MTALVTALALVAVVVAVGLAVGTGWARRRARREAVRDDDLLVSLDALGAVTAETRRGTSFDPHRPIDHGAP